MVDRLVNTDTNRKRIEAVENCFGLSGNKLAIPGRVLVGEGVLTKICRKKPKPRQFFLFSDVLVYGTVLVSKKKYANQHMIPLEDVTLSSLDDTDDVKNGWLIKTPTKSFVVCAATPTERSEWMAHLSQCISELIKRTGKQQSTEPHAAVWQPDNNTKVCMHCNQTKFTVMNRRHHCRHCGLVCCGSCSKNKFLIKTLSTKPVRVCDSCFNTLCQGRITNKNQQNSQQVPTAATEDVAPERPQRHRAPSANSATSPGSTNDSAPSSPVEQTPSGHNGNMTEDSDSDDEPSLSSGDELSPDQGLETDMGGLAIDNETKPTFYSNSFSIPEDDGVQPPAKPPKGDSNAQSVMATADDDKNAVTTDVVNNN